MNNNGHTPELLWFHDECADLITGLPPGEWGRLIQECSPTVSIRTRDAEGESSSDHREESRGEQPSP